MFSMSIHDHLLLMMCHCSLFFFFNDTATTEIYTLSLHDALPIWKRRYPRYPAPEFPLPRQHQNSMPPESGHRPDRKSTRLNSSHSQISYAVFCLKKKKSQTDGNLHEVSIVYDHIISKRHAGIWCT